jgi:hypothetical protein
MTKYWSELNKLEAGVRTVEVDGSLDCNDGNLLRQWTLEGLGLQRRPLWEISDDLAVARLVTALDDFVSPESVLTRLTRLPEKRIFEHLADVCLMVCSERERCFSE